ncbi:xanthine dehydrogenase family protein molybdopterin-binding subunit [Eubacterium barkeri]|uniref:Xanthine dehydrogenase, molybdenum binding subunit apoprotein n=1 Tax=Eubacterium barkeri TaxID=1528 RepID=A0A1H3EUM2_EUBBA|nr:molybdopterin cofactor-binding domain-containing protein [Eubacterium barkeri]SDX82320.1 xanthine dehydrogenase, molybdenum binding subunit apoprotein [Eubacterium barkeri]
MKYIGQDIPRNDGIDKVTGQGRFTSDVILPRMTYAKILRSPYAHAKVRTIDTSQAEALPGVRAVCTFKNTTPKYWNGAAPMFITPLPHVPVLDQKIFTDEPRYIGDEVAAVAADTEAIAAQALKLINIEWEELPAVYDPLEAVKPDAPKVQPEFANPQFNNICGGPIELDFGGDPKKAFETCDVVVDYDVTLPRVKQAQMEPCGAIAEFSHDGRLEITSTTQAPYVTKMILAEALDLPTSKVTVKNPPYVGGGFGVRIGLSGKAEILAAALAMQCHRPVKLIYSREEDFTCTDTRHGGYLKCRLGATKDGTLIAINTEAWLNTGAYATFGTDLVGVCGACGTAGAYSIPNFHYTGWPVYTNQVNSGAMRGFGSPQGNTVVESAMDLLAKELKMDAIELRKKNATREDSKNWFPFPPGSCGMNECLDKAATAIDWAEKRGRADAQTGRTRRGVGISGGTHVSNAAPFCVDYNTVMVRIEGDGTLFVNSSIPEIGPGSTTACLQVACDLIGAPFKDSVMKFGDTDAAPFDIGSHATRTLYTVSHVLTTAAQKLRIDIFEYVSQKFDVASDALDMEEGIITSKGKPVTTLAEAAMKAHLDGHQFVASASQAPPNCLPFYAQAAEVEVDTETGMIKVLKIAAAHDVGKAVSPKLCKGQIEGGVLQGVGYALREEMTYVENKGFYNKSFHSYMLPTGDDRPEIESILVENPDPSGVYGIIGIGECGVNPTLAAIGNAVEDAIGIRFHEFPLTPGRVLAALKEKAQQ